MLLEAVAASIIHSEFYERSKVHCVKPNSSENMRAK